MFIHPSFQDAVYRIGSILSKPSPCHLMRSSPSSLEGTGRKKTKSGIGQEKEEVGVSGVGHRWLLSRRSSESLSSGILAADAGTSHPIYYLYPRWMLRRKDTSSIKIGIRMSSVPLRSMDRFKIHHKTRAQRLFRLRPRCPYTGQGIIDFSHRYPKLKSTKTSKK